MGGESAPAGAARGGVAPGGAAQGGVAPGEAVQGGVSPGGQYEMKLPQEEQLVMRCFFSFVFLCSKEHFSIFFVQYLGVTAGIEPAT
jgi:hypothetical protein